MIHQRVGLTRKSVERVEISAGAVPTNNDYRLLPVASGMDSDFDTQTKKQPARLSRLLAFRTFGLRPIAVNDLQRETSS